MAVDDSLRAVATTDDMREANGWTTLLSAVQLPHRVVDSTIESLLAESTASARFHLVVSAQDADRVQALLDAQREEDDRVRVDVIEQDAPVGSPWAMTLGIAALLSVIYWRTPGFDGPLSPRLEIESAAVRAGEWWRLVTAVFLHGDAGHIASNLAFLIPAGFFVGRRFGSGHVFASFAMSGALGNLLSVAVHPPPYVSLGASGGVFGLWGVLIGAAFASARGRPNPLQRRRELYGAAMALVGLTAFSPHADMVAHIGGLFAGVAYGFVPWRRGGVAIDRVMGLVGFALVAAAFHAAAQH